MFNYFITQLKLAPIFIVCFFFANPVFALVQMGKHMDFILDDGMTVRVFPEAEKSKKSSSQGKWQRSPANLSNKIGKGTDVCKQMEDQFEKRDKKRWSLFKVRATSKKTGIPRWLKNQKNVRNIQMPGVDDKPSKWYYLPAEPRLSFKGDNPEATFVKFMTDKTSGEDATSGGLFHLMVTYGLTKAQEGNLRELLNEAVPGSQLMGMLDIQASKSGDNFIVVSGTMSDKGFAPGGVITSGHAPTMPGSKAAIAGKVSKLGAQLLEATFDNPTADMSVTFLYDYLVKTNAFTAEISVNLDKIRQFGECTLKQHGAKTKSYRKWLWVKGTKIVGITESDKKEAFDVLFNVGAIDIKIDQNLPDVDMSDIESSLIQKAMDSFLSMQKTFASDNEIEQINKNNKEKEKESTPNALNWQVYKVSRKHKKMKGILNFKVTKGIALYRSVALTGNLGSILREHKDEVFDEITLNDPFFKHGKVVVSLGEESLGLFEKKLVNNVNVDVKVKFDKGRDFTEQYQFNRKSIESGETITTLTFATRGENTEKKSCPYEYKVKWNLKGGGKWPLKSKYECGKDVELTLSLPIIARTVDVESDLDELEQAGFRAADVQLRYQQYGKKKTKAVRFRVAKGEPYKEEVLYVDENANDVEYRIIMTHKQKGKIEPTEWQKLDGEFIFANVSGLSTDFLDKLVSLIPDIGDFLP